MLVQRSVADRFDDLLMDKTRSWRHGDPADRQMQMGTVIDEHAACTFEERVNRAISQGARLLHGNQREGALYSPTVLDHVRPDLDIVTKELFGPVSPVIRFDTIDDAIRIRSEEHTSEPQS